MECTENIENDKWVFGDTKTRMLNGVWRKA